MSGTQSRICGPMEKVMLPSGPQCIVSGVDLNQSLGDVKLTSGLKSIIYGFKVTSHQ